MCADIYRTQTANTFLLVPRGAALDTVPDEILTGLGRAVLLNTRDVSDPLLRADASEINSDLASHGFSVRTA
jgi:uncharacterized protein YcgL (UPF0745 family)